MFTVSSIARHAVADVAVLKLSAPVTGIEPSAIDLGQGPVVAGVTSGPPGSCLSDSCLSEQSDDVNVYSYRSFILGQLGTDATNTCGGLPPVGDAQVEVLGFDGRLDDAVQSASCTISVANGQNSLRIGLNAVDTYRLGELSDAPTCTSRPALPRAPPTSTARLAGPR